MMSGDPLSEEEVEHSTVEHDHALTEYLAIIELKKRTNDGRENIILSELELLAPTTLISKDGKLVGLEIAKEGFPDKRNFRSTIYHTDDSTMDTLHDWGQQYRKICDGSAYSDKLVSSGDQGASVGLLFSTYSEDQKRAMTRRNKIVRCAEETCRDIYGKFRIDPLHGDNSYRTLRDELWANYIALTPYDTLTKLYREHSSEIRKFYQLGDRDFIKFIRDCYCNELRLIKKGAFGKPIANISGKYSKTAIQQILRGYATSCMMRVVSDQPMQVPAFAEYYIGKWQFPTLGFGMVSDEQFALNSARGLNETAEILDLIDASNLLALGTINIPLFQNLIDELIKEKIKAPTEGINISSFRYPVIFKVCDFVERIIEDLEVQTENSSSASAKISHLKEFLKEIDGCMTKDKMRIVAKKFKLPSYQQQVQIKRQYCREKMKSHNSIGRNGDYDGTENIN